MVLYHIANLIPSYAVRDTPLHSILKLLPKMLVGIKFGSWILNGLCNHIGSLTVQPEILAGIKFGGWVLNRHCRNIGGFKFGGSVRDCHTYICKYEILADLIWQSQARPPNRQI